tara:strand:+ start:365 stop:556 length:192 start_codon:yes stop_codon:yes gene_type:complete
MMNNLKKLGIALILLSFWLLPVAISTLFVSKTATACGAIIGLSWIFLFIGCMAFFDGKGVSDE